jgi:hypothetical protein
MKKASPEIVSVKTGNIEWLDRLSLLAAALPQVGEGSPLLDALWAKELSAVTTIGTSLGYTQSEISTAFDIITQEIFQSEETSLH